MLTLPHHLVFISKDCFSAKRSVTQTRFTAFQGLSMIKSVAARVIIV
ncbi:hypothetical protein [Endozoicomonas arenosclerae]|nr:hypothetical protein [Endozoicomonas arenosclerae]